MLLEFSIKNFKTFKEKVTLSLLASNYDKDTREDENVHYESKFGLRLLKSAVIYGANASGKSKLLDAIAFMRFFVINSSRESLKGDDIGIEPFKLNTETENEPSEFEVIFVHEKVLYRYGFEVTAKKVTAEWLFHRPKTKEVELFYRDENNFETHPKSFAKGKAIIKEGLVRDNALLLSVAAQFNDIIATTVTEWFKKLKTISGLNEHNYKGYSLGRTEDEKYKTRIIELLKAADFGIEDVLLQKLDVNALPKELPKELRDRIAKEMNEENAEYFSDALILRKKFDSNKRAIKELATLSFDDDESAGTQKFFALLGPILDVLENGYILVVDELDSKLHPNLVCKIVALFNSDKMNPNNAQLIFNTHDTNLLSSGLFRRDQIWFVEKNKFGEAKLYSLADFRSDEVKKNEYFEENYIKGKYGAIPFLGLFDNLTNAFPRHENEK